MILTIIAKKRESNGKKWFNFTANRKGVWYNVKFVHEAADVNPPKIEKIDDNVYRVFVELDPVQHSFNIKTDSKGYKTIFIDSYGTLSKEALEQAIQAEKTRIAEYRKKRDEEKLDFCDDGDDGDIPF